MIFGWVIVGLFYAAAVASPVVGILVDRHDNRRDHDRNHGYTVAGIVLFFVIAAFGSVLGVSILGGGFCGR